MNYIPGCARFVTETVMWHGIWHQVTSNEGNLGNEGDEVQKHNTLDREQIDRYSIIDR